MGIVDKIKTLVQGVQPDALEWDASDPAGDESKYDGLAVESAPYDHKLFVKGEAKRVN